MGYVSYYANSIAGFGVVLISTVLTDNPGQRPLSAYFDSLFVMAAYGGTAVFVGNYLVPKYHGFTSEALFGEYVLWVVLLSFLCTLLAMVGIAKKDKPDNIQRQSNQQRIRVKDYFEIVIHNKPIRMLILAVCTDKFAATVYSHTTVGVMLYGIMMKNYTISGLIGIVTAVPTLLVVSYGIHVAKRMGQKRALVILTALGIFFQIIMALILMQENIHTVSFHIKKVNAITIAFVLVYILLNGCKSIANNMVVPMIADCTDYERYRSGKFVPGLMGALFSFVDKVFAALGVGFVGVVMLIMGYNKRLPQIGDEATPVLKWTTLFLYCGVPIIGWICSLISMRYYTLDKKKMYEIIQNRYGVIDS